MSSFQYWYVLPFLYRKSKQSLNDQDHRTHWILLYCYCILWCFCWCCCVVVLLLCCLLFVDLSVVLVLVYLCVFVAFLNCWRLNFAVFFFINYLLLCCFFTLIKCVRCWLSNSYSYCPYFGLFVIYLYSKFAVNAVLSFSNCSIVHTS